MVDGDVEWHVMSTRAIKKYKVGTSQRLANWYFLQLTTRGWGLRTRFVMTVRGRNTGIARSTPVDVIDLDAHQWLVAPYGTVNWVRNVRASPEITLRRGQSHATFYAREVDATMSVPVIREYIKNIRITRAYWECAKDASDDEIREIAPLHPVFQLERVEID
jgi:deazaflavin-dependent oxidoreductase (nitroreductase family)